MKTRNNSLAARLTRREKAIALVTVLALVSMLTIFCLALLTMGTAEKKAAFINSEGELARQYADTAVNLVMGQIWNGTKQVGGQRKIWASQPGAIRKYNGDGSFHSGYRLYSSSSMKVTGAESQMIADSPPNDWSSQPAKYADLNEPVVKPKRVSETGAGGMELYFPIADPRAYIPNQDGAQNSTNVEGFWYNGQFPGVTAANARDDENARLPMPVEWLYMLKDGTMGTMTGAGGGEGRFQAVTGGGNPSESNPIVARLAFWTDDETCKLNINTASEPTHWSLPTFAHRRDMYWAHYQPTSNEYSRFPGHPATVALSTVLFPNTNLDVYPTKYSPGAVTSVEARIVKIKDRIYDVIPKINGGGSRSGTIPYWRFTDRDQDNDGKLDSNENYLQGVEVTEALKERLYATVDEFLFSQNIRNNGRSLVDEGADTPIFQAPADIERTRFFLTAHSRMPEVTMFGTPRVAIWPIHEDGRIGEQSRRTGFDRLIAFCSTLGRPNGSNSYFFQRGDPFSATHDINIPRNLSLMAYLTSLMGRTYPGGSSLTNKFGADATQIMVEIFDYIRSTNLYDGYLAKNREEIVPKTSIYAVDNTTLYNNGPGETHNDGQFYRKRPTDYRTYTPYRMSRERAENNDAPGAANVVKRERTVDRSFPGHGQVIPSEYQNGNFRGIGRFVTVTEFGLQFLCSADGNPDKGSYRNRTDVTPQGHRVPGWPGANAAAAQAATGAISGGRTALRIIPDPFNTYNGEGQSATKKVNWSNGRRVNATNERPGQYDVWYSNYPPFPRVGAYGTSATLPAYHPQHPNNHPGFNPRNWNVSLKPNTPLKPGQKMIQGLMQIELTNVAAGNTVLHPDFSIVIKGADSWKVDGNPLFTTGAAGRIIWKSGRPLFDLDNCWAVGGSVNSAALGDARQAKSPGAGLPADPGFDLAANTGGDKHRGLRNLELLTNFFLIEGKQMTFTGNPVTITIYVGHDTDDSSKIVQEIEMPMPSTLNLPTPHLCTLTTDHVGQQDSQGNTYQRRCVEATSWWAFNFGGVINRFTGTYTAPQIVTFQINNQSHFFVDADGTRPAGRLAGYQAGEVLSRNGVPQGNAILWGYDSANGNYSSGLMNPLTPSQDQSGDQFSDTGLVDMNDNEVGPRRAATGTDPSPDNRGTDVLFTMVPKHSDFRLLMAKKKVPASDWVIHPKAELLLQTRGAFFAHNLTRYNSNTEPAFDQGASLLRLVPNATYGAEKRPDVAPMPEAINLAKRYGDFDNGIGTLRDGPWINYPDAGNSPVNWRETENDEIRRMPTAYLSEQGGDGNNSGGEDPGDNFMTPNRMVPSPGVFGSLPTGVKAGDPWKTLLFRPHTRREGATAFAHPGGPSWTGGVDPADHYIMDLFWMPVVEPYAISEPFSTAGKINLNYQMLPFQNHIRRATGIHAVLKGEILSAVPLREASNYKNRPSLKAHSVLQGEGDYDYYGMWRDYGLDNTNDQEYTSKQPFKFWHRNINIEKRVAGASSAVNGTIKQFEDRFNHVGGAGVAQAAFGLFRTASQICEVHLIPEKITGTNPNTTGADIGGATPYRVTDMDLFWSLSGTGSNSRMMTGDNTRERPYANIYGKITTQSNTFRVFVKAQVIKKARSVDPSSFDPDKDSITGEFRGSALIERRIDPLDPRIPDYASNPSANPLDDFYRFRVLEMKRFNP